jgi:hypothetical protein
LRAEIVEQLDEQQQRLGEQGKGSVLGKWLASRGGEETVDVGEELEIWLAESGEDKVDFRVEAVGTELGAPAALFSSAETNTTVMGLGTGWVDDAPSEDGMSGSKDTVVDDKVIWRETLHQFLRESA